MVVSERRRIFAFLSRSESARRSAYDGRSTYSRHSQSFTGSNVAADDSTEGASRASGICEWQGNLRIHRKVSHAGACWLIDGVDGDRHWGSRGQLSVVQAGPTLPEVLPPKALRAAATSSSATGPAA